MHSVSISKVQCNPLLTREARRLVYLAFPLPCLMGLCEEHVLVTFVFVGNFPICLLRVTRAACVSLWFSNVFLFAPHFLFSDVWALSRGVFLGSS